MCGLEALGIAADWSYPAPISRTPIYAYSLMLLFDFLFYSLAAAMVVDSYHRTRTPTIAENIEKGNGSCNEKKNKKHKNGRSDTNKSKHTDTPITSVFSTFQKNLISMGIWTLKILGSAFSCIFREIFNGLGYFWGGRNAHTYTSLQQHQQQQQELNSDIYKSITSRSRMEGSMSCNEFGRNSSIRTSPRRPHSKSFSLRSPSTLSSHPVSFTNDLKSSQSDGISFQRKTGASHDGIQSTERGARDSYDTGNIKEKVKTVKEENDVEEEIEEASPYEDNGRSKRKEDNENSSTKSPRQACMRISDVSKEYSTGVVILHRVCAELKQGTVTCLLGKYSAYTCNPTKEVFHRITLRINSIRY